MTPYAIGKDVVIDPCTPNDKLRFGFVEQKLYDQVGKIIKLDYFNPDKCMAYLVKFPTGESLWFKEDELV